jgi:AcrR family transcriptional regulator
VSLIEEKGQFTVADVTERSGASPATIYRYYPDRDALIRAAAFSAGKPFQPTADPGTTTSLPRDMHSYRRALPTVWAWHEQDIPRLVAGLATPIGRELRAMRLRERREIFAEGMEAEGFDPASPEGQRVMVLTMVLGSSTTFLELHDAFGLGAAEAAEMVSWAFYVIARATREGWRLDEPPH